MTWCVSLPLRWFFIAKGTDMKRHPAAVAIAMALTLCGSVAQADEFNFLIGGGGPVEVTDAPGCNYWGCDPYVSGIWYGSLKLVLAGTGDGVYTEANIQSLAVWSNWQSYTWSNGDPGLFNTPSVTVQNGVVTDLEFHWVIDEAHREVLQLTTYSGPWISAYANGDCSGCGRTDAVSYTMFGGLTAVPEPTNAALLLVSLGLLGATSTRRRALRGPTRGIGSVLAP